MAEYRGLMIVGHGSRSEAGQVEYWELVSVLEQMTDAEVGCGFIELAEPRLDQGIEALVDEGVSSVVAVPLVLLGAGHLKDDGPLALERARLRHPGVEFHYARHLGIHPKILALAEERVRDVASEETFVVVVGRGSSDPDANSDLYKVARLLWDGRGFAGVEPAFVSLAPPSVPAALDRCRRLGARRVAVVPYFLFTGVLVERIRAQARKWAREHPDVEVAVGSHLGPVEPIAEVVLERYDEALAGGALMNCDLCIYRVALPGYEERVGAAAGYVVPANQRKV